MKAFLIFISAFFILASPAFGEAKNYGTWNGSQSYSGQVPVGKAYDSDLDPFSDQGGEYSNFICATPSGVILSQSDQKILAEIFNAATDVYNGEFILNTEKDPLLSDLKPPENGGYPTGSSGLNQFVQSEKALLESGRWVPYKNRVIVKSSSVKKSPEIAYAIPSEGWSGKLLPAPQISISKGIALSSILTEESNHPISLGVNLPEACALGAEGPTEPLINDLFANPGKFQSDSFLYIPTSLAVSALEFFQPYAFKWTFWTPHSERSDLIWNTPDSCAPTATNGYLNKSCFANSNSESSSSGEAWYLKVAHFLQWLVSGTYLIIFTLATVLFMLKSNRKTQIELTTILPRVLGAMLLTAFAGYFIGAMISVSNIMVQTIFNFSDTQTIGIVNVILAQAGNILGGGSVMNNVGQLIVAGFSSVYFIIFVLFAILKQILLILLIVLFPVAALTLITPRWQNNFFMYLRALITLIFIPVVLAFIFKISLSINPLVLDPVGSYGNLKGFLGLILMLVTFWLMYRAIKLSIRFIIGGSNAVVEVFVPEKDGYLGSLLDKINNSPKNPTMIPEGRGSVNQSGSSKVPITPAFPTQTLANRTLPSRSPGGSLAEAIENRGEGSSRVSNHTAKAYKDKLRAAIGAATARKGAPLTEEEMEKIKKSFARKNGGKLAKKDGSYYLNPVDEDVVQSRSEKSN
jgi:hypothetical protein